MKRILITILVIILQLNIALSYTTTIRAKGIGVVVTSGVGNVITTTPTAPDITGWEVTPNTVELVNNQFTMPEGDVLLEAITTTYIITFNSNEGSGSMAQQTFTPGKAQNLTLNTFTKENYIFKGWSTTETGEVEYTDGASYIATTDTTLYAVWIEKPPYTITTVTPEGVTIEGEYTNYRCSECGGTDHICEVVNIMIEEGNSVVEEWGEDTTSPTTIIIKSGNAIIEGEYTNYRCSECGGTDHECEVVNIMVEENNSSVTEI